MSKVCSRKLLRLCSQLTFSHSKEVMASTHYINHCHVIVACSHSVYAASNSPCRHARQFHTCSPLEKYLDPRDEDQDDKEYELSLRKEHVFEEIARLKKVKNSATFKLAVAKFVGADPVYRRGHVEFIYAAIRCMKEFGVEKDISAYKLILDLFPKGKMVAESMWQVEMMHYPKQQYCCIDVLDFMESNGKKKSGKCFQNKKSDNYIYRKKLKCLYICFLVYFYFIQIILHIYL